MPKNYNLFLRGDVGHWYFSSDMVNVILDRHPQEEVSVLINSLGGYAHEAIAISSLFRLHGNVHVHYVGMNASAATIASMGAKHVTMDADAAYLVHKCLMPVLEWDYMNADELQAHIDELEKQKTNQCALDSVVAGMYARRCKKTKEELLALMSKDTWLTAEEALEWGFVDEITNYAEDAPAEITPETAEALASAGIPLPAVLAKGGRKESIISRFLKLFTSSNQTACSEEPTVTKPTSMPKVFTALAAAVGAAVAVTDGSVTFTEEQADAVEKALSDGKTTIDSLNASVAEKDATIATLEAKVKDLSKEPAAATSTVVEKPAAEPDADRLADALLAIIP